MANHEASQPFSSNTLRHSREAGFTLIEVLLVLIMLGVVAYLFLMPSLSPPPEARYRTECRHNLKEIGYALHVYHDDYRVFPPAYTVDTNGKPLHSWRTLLLPYLDRKDLYDRLDLSKPWNAPENASVFENQSWLQCPSLKKLPQSQTTYLAIVTDTSCIRLGQSLTFPEVTDGTSNTMCVIEVRQDQAVPWMEPRDLDSAGLLAFGPETQETHTDRRHILMMDGSVLSLSRTTPHETIKALATAAGGETIAEF